MNKSILYVFMVLMVSSISGKAFSAVVTTVSGSPSIADGVTGIVLGGITYDADFFYSGPTHTEIANDLSGLTQSEANNIMNQIGSAFSAANIGSVRYESLSSPGSTFDLNNATLWYAENGSNLIGVNISSVSLNWGFVGASNAPLNSAKPFFVELTPVPVPGAVWLFGSALMVGSVIARRNRQI